MAEGEKPVTIRLSAFHKRYVVALAEQERITNSEALRRVFQAAQCKLNISDGDAILDGRDLEPNGSADSPSRFVVMRDTFAILWGDEIAQRQWPREVPAIQELAARYDPVAVRDCYNYHKRHPFWKDKFLGADHILRQIGAYVRCKLPVSPTDLDYGAVLTQEDILGGDN